MPPVTRSYNRIQINNLDATITKSSDTERFRDEIAYYHKIPSRLRYLFPQIVNEKPVEVEFEMILADHPSMYNTWDDDSWFRFFLCLKRVLNKMHSVTSPTATLAEIQESAYKMYHEKTFVEYEKFKEQCYNNSIHDLVDSQSLYINDSDGSMVELKNFVAIKDRVVEYINKNLIPSATLSTLSMIHGDLCFNNILFQSYNNTGKISLIDPRGSWGTPGIFGDPRYDFAKLYHSINAQYESITNDKYVDFVHGSHQDGYKVLFFYPNPQKSDKILNIFETVFEIQDPQIYNFIAGLIYIGMCARHSENQEHQIIMYAEGVRLLNEVLFPN